MAVRAALAFSSPSRPFRFLYISGPAGSGKTRLLRGILARFAQRKARYWTAAEWLSRFRAAQRRKERPAMTKAHLALEALLIDDVEALSESPSAQRALAEILDAPGGPAAAFGGRLSPNQLPLEDRFRDRLSAGFVATLGESRPTT